MGFSGTAAGEPVVTQDVPDQFAETTWSDCLRALTLKQYVVFGSTSLAPILKPTMLIALVGAWLGVVWYPKKKGFQLEPTSRGKNPDIGGAYLLP
ncbi:hypothetical protein, partial [Mesorhizobium sp.]|uniref:hypothetical protein n=1 Tax=Mesorhizobium sp. TaxID=1871066 RepID=UPI0025FEDED4